MYTYTLVPVFRLTLLDNVTCVNSVHKNPVVLTKQLVSVHSRTFRRVWRKFSKVVVDGTFCISVCCIFHRKSENVFRLGPHKNLHSSLFLVLWKNMHQVFIENKVKEWSTSFVCWFFYRQCTALTLLCLIDLLVVFWCVLLNCRTNDARKKLAWCFVSSRVKRPKSCDVKKITSMDSFCLQSATLASCKWITKRGLGIKAFFFCYLIGCCDAAEFLRPVFLGSWNGEKKNYVYENVHRVAGNEWMLFAW